MSIKINPIEILVYYDGPEIFLSKDQVGTMYLCMLCDIDGNQKKFLCAPISDKRYLQFFCGDKDLRSIFETTETGKIFLTSIDGEDIEELDLVDISSDEIKEEWLPEEGFLLDKASIDDEVLSEEAVRKGRMVVHFSLSPSESRDETKISVENLTEGLWRFQSFIKYSYKNYLRSLNEGARNRIKSPEHYKLDVFDFSPGSFTLHLQSRQESDLTGFVQLTSGMERMDKLLESINDKDKTLEELKGSGSHLISAYRNLLHYIINNNIPVKYSWKTPLMKKINHYTIDKEIALPIYESLNEWEKVFEEKKEFIGKVSKADVKNGGWRLICEDGKEILGKSNPVEVRLQVSMDTHTYRFICREEIEMEKGTGKEKTEYWLLDYEEVE